MGNTQDTKMEAALYARVSSEEQVEGYSIDAQIRAFETLVEVKGWAIYKEYIEEGKSARTENINKRPVFKEAIADGLDRRYDILVVHKVDRFSRKLRITLEYFDKLGKAEVGFVSIVEQMDFSTPWGKFTLSMLGGLAELYSDNLSQETKKGWHERRAQGLYCGTLPFGAAKSGDGIPVPDMLERKIAINDHERTVRNYEGLKMAFELGAQGKSDREVAITLNAGGYRTTGTHGSRSFSKDTLKDMLKNKFYIGYIDDGKGEWIKAKHQPFISQELFETVQATRSSSSPGQTINSGARIYSLSCITRCARCGGSIRMQTSPKGKARVYCASRTKNSGCDFSGTFLDVYERQIEWYLTTFIIPDDYKQRVLEAHRKVTAAYNEIEDKCRELEASLARLKDQYHWGHIGQVEYLKEYRETELQLRQFSPVTSSEDNLKRLADFLANVAEAWREANQEQKNKLARVLFEEIKLDNGGKIVVVKPRPELEPFFKLSYECHARDIAGDPGGI